jgi:hypothetical protein
MDQVPAATWRENLNTVIALVALIQMWLYWAWRKFFRRGSISIFETGTIEGGYSSYGPTIGVQGTLHGREREMFVRVISLEVFEWTLFKSVRFVTTRPTEVAFQLPAGFLLLPSQPFRYNLLFNDTSFQQQHVQPVIDTLRTAWIVAVQRSLGGAPLNPQQAQAQIQHASQAAYPAFSGQPHHVNAFTQLSQQFYWNPGWYKLSIRIATAHPERTFTEGWRFELTQAQSNSLRLNAIKVVQEVCGQYIGEYNFAYVAYRPPARP